MRPVRVTTRMASGTSAYMFSVSLDSVSASLIATLGSTVTISSLNNGSVVRASRFTRTRYAGGLGLLLTAIGLYGVLALAVGERTREIGVRMALGARVPAILSLILREGLALAVAGLAVGLASALMLSDLLTRFLYGIRPDDPVTYTVAAVLVGGVALAACAVPAWRAARVDPVVALRYE